MFQRAMSAKLGEHDPKFVKQVSGRDLYSRSEAGEWIVKTVPYSDFGLDSLIGSMAQSLASKPLLLPKMVSTVLGD